MARSSKAANTEAVEPEQVAEASETAEAVEVDGIREQRATFLSHLDRMLSLDGRLQAVQCDLPGYTGVTVYYNMDNTYGIARLLEEMPRGLDNASIYRLWSLFMRRFEGLPDGVHAGRRMEWPTPDDPESYGLIWEQMRSFALWCLFDGYQKAKRLFLGNS